MHSWCRMDQSLKKISRTNLQFHPEGWLYVEKRNFKLHPEVVTDLLFLLESQLKTLKVLQIWPLFLCFSTFQKKGEKKYRRGNMLKCVKLTKEWKMTCWYNWQFILQSLKNTFTPSVQITKYFFKGLHNWSFFNSAHITDTWGKYSHFYAVPLNGNHTRKSTASCLYIFNIHYLSSFV
jgi:hypothetical protein